MYKKLGQAPLWLVVVFLLLSHTPILAAQYKNAEVPVNKTKYSANVKTYKYHRPGCKYYDCRDRTKFFKTPKAAQKAGYEPCKVCGRVVTLTQITIALTAWLK